MTAWSRRAPAVLLTLGLQASFLALLLYSFQHFTPPRVRPHETILLLPQLVKPETVVRTIDARGRAVMARPLAVPQPQFTAPAGAAAPAITTAPPDMQSFGRALNGCAPEDYAGLTSEQRARCARPGEGVAIQQAPDLMGSRSHVKDPAHWAEELAREQGNVILPCMGGLDLLCVLKTVATGDFSQVTDPRRWPHYEVQQIPPEDFKKIQQAYDAWHQAHRESPPAVPAQTAPPAQ